jgi:group I intron endonuclease
MNGGVNTSMPKKIGKIYLIRNILNSKGYVGQTIRSVSYRFNQHKYETKTGCDRAIHRAMRKWGFENFTVEQVVSCDPLLLDDLEKHYIKFYNTYAPVGHGYNLTEGGGNGRDDNGERILSVDGRTKLSEVHKGNSYAKGHKVSDEARAAMSAGQRNRKHHSPSAEERERVSAKLKGHPVSSETRAKLSKANKGKKRDDLKGKIRGPMTEETKEKIAAILRGKKKSPESTAKRLATRSAQGWKVSEETKKKISNALKGRIIPAEQRVKMLEGRKRYYEKLNDSKGEQKLQFA